MVRLVHPFPSVLNALLVFGLAAVAIAHVDLAPVLGGRASTALFLALAMLLIQFAIGAANDWFDVERDRLTKPAKPIPGGLVTRRQAAVAATSCGGGGLLLGAAVPGAPQPATLALLGAMLGAGLAYDAWLKPTPFSWLPFAVAFPLLPLYAWYGATGFLPPYSALLLPVAFMAGPTLQLANGLVDVERDARAGAGGLAALLGRRRAWLAMAVLQAAILLLAWATVAANVASRGTAALVLLVAATAVIVAGVGLSAATSTTRREWGWRCQAVGIALLAVGWLAAIPNAAGLPGG